jgi:hypothetical protein
MNISDMDKFYKACMTIEFEDFSKFYNSNEYSYIFNKYWLFQRNFLLWYSQTDSIQRSRFIEYVNIC